MASGEDQELIKKFEAFCDLAGSKDKRQMTSKANGKLVKDCFEPDYKKYDVKAICDASIFPAVKDAGKPCMTVSDVSVKKYLAKTAHEIAKKKSKNPKIKEDDAEVESIKTDLIKCIHKRGPQVKTVKPSATGGVDKMTDTSQYTGAHKGRFDEDGKGRGIKGRADIAKNTGYVGNYKNEGSYSKK